MEIRNKKDLSIAYVLIKFTEGNDVKTLPEATQEMLKDLKKSAREYVKREKDRRLINWDYDGYVELIKLPVNSLEEAEEYFAENEEKHCPPSQYDCTGNLFTRWHKIARRSDGYYAYHSIGVDV